MLAPLVRAADAIQSAETAQVPHAARRPNTAWPRAVRAQEAIPRVAVVLGFEHSDQQGQARLAAIVETLARLGWSDDHNVRLDIRWADYMNREVLVILVHGTWARNALWCLPDSDLCKYLRGRFGSSIKFNIFPWSGWNLHRARILAGKRLSGHILRVAASNPDTKIVLVGHSHGGNVIRYSLRHDPAARNVAGVITLATPFITSTARPFTEWGFFIIRAFANQAVLLAVTLLLFALYYSMPFWLTLAGLVPLPPKIIDWGVNFVIGPGALLLFQILRWLYVDPLALQMASTEGKLIARQTAIVETIDPPRVEGVPLQSIEVRADEPRFVLGTADYLSRWSHTTLSSSFLNKFVFYAALPGTLMYLLWPWFGLFAQDFFIHQLGDVWAFLLVFFTMYVSSLLLASIVIPFVIALLLIISVLVPRLVKAPIFGEETLYETWLVNSVQSANPTDWNPHDHRIITVKKRVWQLGIWRHSLVYSDPAVTSLAADWIQLVITQRNDSPVSISHRANAALAKTDFIRVIEEQPLAHMLHKRWSTIIAELRHLFIGDPSFFKQKRNRPTEHSSNDSRHE
jgi:hypothetical protein